MLPQFNNFIGSTVRGLPGVKPAAQANAGGNDDMMAMIRQLIAGGGQAQVQPGGIPPELMKQLLQDDGPVDVVGQYNRGSNLPSNAAGSTGPWSGEKPLFKPMDQAFPELAAPANPFAGAAMTGNAGPNPFMNFGTLVPPQRKPAGFGASANPQPGFNFR